MAGVPKIFQAMLESLLPRLTGGEPLLSETLPVYMPEGDIAGPLADIAAAYPDLSFGSYPFNQAGQLGANVVIRGSDTGRVSQALAALQTTFEDALG